MRFPRHLQVSATLALVFAVVCVSAMPVAGRGDIGLLDIRGNNPDRGFVPIKARANGYLGEAFVPIKTRATDDPGEAFVPIKARTEEGQHQTCRDLPKVPCANCL